MVLGCAFVMGRDPFRILPHRGRIVSLATRAPDSRPAERATGLAGECKGYSIAGCTRWSGAACPRESAPGEGSASRQQMKDEGSDAEAAENQGSYREKQEDLERHRGHTPSQNQRYPDGECEESCHALSKPTGRRSR